MGTALRPGNGTTFALEAQTDQRQLAGGRDVLQLCVEPKIGVDDRKFSWSQRTDRE
jgi:hypothetical protein